MRQQLTWMIGGQQGEGIESGGDLLANSLVAQGYYLYGYRLFSSRIRGGHTHYSLRIGVAPLASLADQVDLLIALGQETISLCGPELAADGLVLADGRFKPQFPEVVPWQGVRVPLSELAEQAGSLKMRNVVAFGMSMALFRCPSAAGLEALNITLSNKDQTILAANRRAFQSGWDYAQENLLGWQSQLALEPTAAQPLRFVTGNEELAAGALAAGVGLMAAYPITPATEIMETLVKKLPECGGIMVQTEDEIAACMMAIGANYAGVRAFTATSGPGLSLMAESIGLASMTETPLVVVNVQRGGPSTGLPTKHEQSDIMAAAFSTHGDAPKIVMASDSIATIQADTATAFNLAEQFQLPVIFLSDMQLSLGKQTLTATARNNPPVERGRLLAEADLPKLNPNQYFKRYQLQPDGISPRVLPGTSNGIHHVTGLEHDETGRPFEGTVNRVAQTEKRWAKLAAVHSAFPEPVRVDAPFERGHLLVLTLGGACGAVAEAVHQLRRQGEKINVGYIRLLQPFPVEFVQVLISGSERLAVVEHNASGQLAWMIQANCSLPAGIHAVRKYDGNPFRPGEILTGLKGALAR